MKKYLILLLAVIAAPVFAQTQQLTILHFNDLHGHLEKASRIAAKVNEIRDLEPSRTFLVMNGGDVISGTPISAMTKGSAEWDFLSMIGNSATAIGNHEFDFGLPNLEALISSHSFDTVSGNIYKKGTKNLLATPYVLKGRIGILGLSHRGTPYLTNPKNVEALTFTDPIAAARSAMKELIKSTDIQIALTHQGVDNDVALAKKVPGIDLVVGGHDHVKPSEYCRDVGKVPVCQTPPYGTYLGRIDLTIEDGKITEKKETLIPIDDGIRPDKKVERWLAPMFKRIDKETHEVIGHARKDLTKEALGAKISEAMREFMEADIGIINSGSIRRTLKKGKITRGDIMEVFPFQNVVVKIELKGKDIKKLMDAAKNKRSALFIVGPVMTAGLEPDKIYTVATVDFLQNGGDGYSVFKRSKLLDDSGVLVRDVFIDDIKKERKI